MDAARPADLDALLRLHGTLTARRIGEALHLSQPSVSRLLASQGNRIARIGRARATRYALTHGIGRAGSRWPLYRIDATGRAERLGEMIALHGERFLLEPARPLPALLRGEFADGLFPGFPWFLDDQRPQGFLGRAFARRIGPDIGAPDDPLLWSADDIALALLRHGHDMPGDLVLGEAALQRAQEAALSPSDVIAVEQRPARYPELAQAALRGELPGSPAGGEQPKFTAILREGDGFHCVIVKFSERAGSAAAQRWADLLRAECRAMQVLAKHGIAAAQAQIIEADGRVFLESTRFDRTLQMGRRGFVSLAPLAAAFHGHARIQWWRYAGQLQAEGWLGADDARRLRMLGWFGALIANSDMHLGNAGLILADEAPFALAPAWDMLPMAFQPAANGEVVERHFIPPLPTPEHRDDWHRAAVMARAFWQTIADDARIGTDFHAIARDADAAIATAARRA